ncbi:hypothetical protein DAEQUDRAFT_731875 [Daedalea quercina L-15889]|uniref:CHAT domain-containing protein n=1 Tax=Daedalea quercina L-15889 TaxID=1314783 RepID=A0A165LYV2_9APHY|nr:hypothetical protein DAEQUDRAFT_731875 [Daedalea quercina L-15889]
MESCDSQGHSEDFDNDIIARHRKALSYSGGHSLDRSESLRDLGLALHARFDSDGALADLEEAISCLSEALSLHPPNHPERLASLLRLAAALSNRFQQMGRLPDLNDPIALLREALLLASPPHLERPRILAELSKTLLMLAKWSNDSWDSKRVVEAITLLRGALASAPQQPAERAVLFNDLAQSLRGQYLLALTRPWLLSGLPVKILDEAIALHRKAIDADASPSLRRETYVYLALALKDRCTASSPPADLDEAIELHRRALELVQKPGDKSARVTVRAELIAALYTRYDQTKQLADIREAVALHHASLSQPAVRRPAHSYPYNVLAPILRTSFDETRRIPFVREDKLPDFRTPEAMSPENLVNGTAHGDTPVTDKEKKLEAEIMTARQALDAKIKDRWDALDKLGVALRMRCSASAGPNSHEFLQMSSESISLHQEAVRILPDGHPEQARLRYNLGLAYYTHYMRVHNTPSMESLLDFAVEELRKALESRPSSHPDRPATLDGLGVALRTRFLYGGKALDLDEAILMHREALSLRSPPDIDRWASMRNLGEALQARSRHVRQVADLDEAVDLFEEALTMQHRDPATRAELYRKLGLALHARYHQHHQFVDLERALELYRGALAILGQTSSQRPSTLNDLAIALRTHYSETAELEDLDDAIQYHREALMLLPDGHYDRISCLNSLADAHLLRSKEIGRLSDVQGAIELCRVTLQGFHYTDRNNPARCPILETLGTALIERFLRTDEAGNNLEDVHAASDAFQAIAECYAAPLSQRFPAARMWARLSDACDDGHGLALQAYRTTIEFLPLLAGVGADVDSRRRVLTANTDGLAREAAACAIRQKKYKQAVELLEAGRAVFWSQALQLRTPLHDLDAIRPDLANKLRELSRMLEKGALRDASRPRSTVSTQDGDFGLEYEKETAHFSELNADWMEIIEEIQRVPGFQDFLGNKSFDSLFAAADGGPVVLLIASGFRAECTALILTGDEEPLHVPLSGLSYRTVETLANKMRHVLAGNSYRSASQERAAKLVFYGAPDNVHDLMRKVLATLWLNVVHPVLSRLDLQKTETPPRLWWMPTGPFAMLPIHAAGIYGDGAQSTECTGDFVVSSYTPTLQTLLAPLPASSTFKVLAVIQPYAAGQPALPATEEELRILEQYIPPSFLTEYGAPSKRALIQDVLAALPGASIVHFACHGVQDPKNPLKSSLILEDRLKVSQLMELDMPNAWLVFLNACQTAAADDALPDEPIHLAATLLFAGFRGAVATLWSIADEDGPFVVDAFYKSLLATSVDPAVHSPDYLYSANALHAAVKRLRSSGRSFIRWVPFVHLGR